MSLFPSRQVGFGVSPALRGASNVHPGVIRRSDMIQDPAHPPKVSQLPLYFLENTLDQVGSLDQIREYR
jgi:hypothetical protein